MVLTDFPILRIKNTDLITLNSSQQKHFHTGKFYLEHVQQLFQDRDRVDSVLDAKLDVFPQRS